MSLHRVLFYKDENGKSEVVDFIFKSNQRIQAKIYNQIDHLKEFGLSRFNPSVRKVINTPLWEVRILGKDNVRIFCSEVDSEIIIFHIFTKKKQKTPSSDIKIALKRYNEQVDN